MEPDRTVTPVSRPIAMVLVLGLLTLSTLSGLLGAILRHDAFVEKFPGASNNLVFASYVVCAILILACLVGVWFWKQWAIILLCGLTAIVFLFDLVARAPLLHLVAGPLALAAVLLSVQSSRARFRPRK